MPASLDALATGSPLAGWLRLSVAAWDEAEGVQCSNIPTDAVMLCGSRFYLQEEARW